MLFHSAQQQTALELTQIHFEIDFLIVRSEVYISKQCRCMRTWVCVFRPWCSHPGWHSAKWLS